MLGLRKAFLLGINVHLSSVIFRCVFVLRQCHDKAGNVQIDLEITLHTCRLLKSVRVNWFWHYIHYLSIHLYTISWSEPFSWQGLYYHTYQWTFYIFVMCNLLRITLYWNVFAFSIYLFSFFNAMINKQFFNLHTTCFFLLDWSAD